jgi:hypothetical protein
MCEEDFAFFSNHDLVCEIEDSDHKKVEIDSE